MKTIVWDVDDVLNDLMKEWLRFWKQKYPESTLRYEEIKINPPHSLLGISKEEYLASLDEFRLSGKYEKIEPLEEVKAWFVSYGARFRHVALTKIPVVAAPISASWVMRHFGLWIRSFHFIPSYRKNESPPIYDEDKGTYLHYFGKGDLLIDDTLENIASAKRVGVKTLVFPRPWNDSKFSIRETLDRILEVLK